MNFINDINWDKAGGLLPAIIQDKRSMQILMLGYMDKEALQKTIDEKKVYFYSRTRKRLWKKGETSGNELDVIDMKIDCDKDALLVQAIPKGNTCHTGSYSCFNEEERFSVYTLEGIIQERIRQLPEGSYIASLVKEGIERIAQKVGEEATETIIAALAQKDKYKDEASDLLFHFILLCSAMNCTLEDIEKQLARRRFKQ